MMSMIMSVSVRRRIGETGANYLVNQLPRRHCGVRAIGSLSR